VARAIELEGKRRGSGAPSEHRYFSEYDGKPVAWFERDSCVARGSPGYDDLGQELEPATKEKVMACRAFFADLERKGRQQAEAQARREEQQKRAARRRRFQEIGRYIARGNFVVRDGYKIVFEECLVLRYETRLKFRIANLRDPAKKYVDAGFAFGLMSTAGAKSQMLAVRRIHGAVGVAGDGTLIPPGLGEIGSFTAEFSRDSESGTFMIMVNDILAFAKPADHIVGFRGL